MPRPQHDQTPRNPAENCLPIGSCRAHLLQPLQLRRRQERAWNPHPTLLNLINFQTAHAVMDRWSDNCNTVGLCREVGSRNDVVVELLP